MSLARLFEVVKGVLDMLRVHKTEQICFHIFLGCQNIFLGPLFFLGEKSSLAGHIRPGRGGNKYVPRE